MPLPPLVRVPRAPIVGVLLVGTGVAVWRLAPRDRSLDQIAIKLCSAEARRGSTVTRRSAWFSDDTALETDFSASVSAVEVVRRMGLLDLRRGLQQRLAAAADRALQGHFVPLGPSPDGRWMAAWDNRKGSAAYLRAVRLDDGQVTRWPRIDNRDYIGHGWLPARDTYVVLYADKTVLLRVDKAQVAERIRISPLPRDLGWAGVLPDGPMLVPWSAFWGPVSRISAYRLQVDLPAPRLRTFTIALPGRWVVHQVQASPQGDRLLWRIQRPPVAGFIGRLLRLVWRSPAAREELWVSRPDGSAMHETCCLTDPDLVGVSPDALIEWTPDGRRLSFERAGYLYTVPIDG